MRIAVAGSSGRMGQTIIKKVVCDSELKLVLALDSLNSKLIDEDATCFMGKISGINIENNIENIKKADCLIDFTRPEGTMSHLSICLKYKINIVIGTTGFNKQEKFEILKASKNIGVVFSPNMSIGINITIKILEIASRMLKKGFNVEIFEAHHNKKIDAPSGTAIAMGEAISKSWGINLNDVATWTRYGNKCLRNDNNIGFSVLRGGDIIGDHTVYFCGNGERIEITHRSNNRQTYANGSIIAAKFLKDKKLGCFDMKDVLKLN